MSSTDLQMMTGEELEAEYKFRLDALNTAVAAESEGMQPGLPGTVPTRPFAAIAQRADAVSAAEAELAEVRDEMARRRAMA